MLLYVLLLPLLWFGIKAGWNKANTDFPNYYVSAQLLIKGHLADAYDVALFNTAIHEYNSEASGLFVMYPPTTSLLALGLTSFDLLNAKRIWILISLIAIVGIVFLLKSICNIDKTSASVFFLLSGFSLYNDLMLGQVYLVMLAFILLGWIALVQNKAILSGMSWGFVAAFKFLPLFFIPFLLFKKQYKITFFLLLSFMVIHLFTLVIGGTDAYNSFFQVFIDNYLHGKVANQTALSIQYQSMEALANLLSQLSHWPNWSVNLLKIIWKVIWLCFVILLWLKYFNSKYFLIVSLTSVTLILLLFENGSASYHLLFCLFASMAFLQIVKDKCWKITLFLAYATIGFIPVLISLLHIDNLFVNFSRLWCLSLFAAIFFIGLLKQPNFTK
jgi:hypothetical protein